MVTIITHDHSDGMIMMAMDVLVSPMQLQWVMVMTMVKVIYNGKGDIATTMEVARWMTMEEKMVVVMR